MPARQPKAAKPPAATAAPSPLPADFPTDLPIETLPIADLKPHPRNYQQHPDDQIAHLAASIREHGLYRPVVIAADQTILAGHGIVKAAQSLGLKTIPVVRLPIAADDPRALKVVIGDNEIRHLADRDDRALTELLKEIRDVDVAGLLGTGYDDMMVANLLFVTRTEAEIATFDEATHWVGMPEYAPGTEPLKCNVSFRTEADRKDFFAKLGLTFTEKTNSVWWPPRERDDIASVKFVG